LWNSNRMTDMQFIDISSLGHIRNLLKNIHLTKNEFQIWQSINSTKSFKIGIIKKINSWEESFEIIVKNKELSSFDIQQEIFFKSEYKNILFKSKIAKIEKNHLKIFNPTVVKIREERRDKRKSHGMASYHTIHVKFKNIVLTKAQIFDSSLSGLSLIVNKYIFDTVLEGDVLNLNESTINPFCGKAAIIRNKTPLSNSLSGENMYRLGIEIL